MNLQKQYIDLCEDFKDVLVQQTPDSQHQDLPSQIVAIDLGSNSFHMVIASTSHGEIRTMDKLGEKVQLASGLSDKGYLSEDSQTIALNCLSRFAQRLQGIEGESVRVVATNTLRVAKNRKAFIRKAEKIIGKPIEIISGREEARLVYLGVAHSLADDEGKRLVIDIGGGSTEFIIGERFETKATESLHMGCVSYRERFFKDGKLSKSAFDKAIRLASTELLHIKVQYRKLGWQGAVGSSGSIKAVLNALKSMGLAEDVITMEAMEELKEKLCSWDHVDVIQKLGVKKERISIFPSGFAILYACFKQLGITEMSVANGALREGVLYDMIGRIKHEDVRERTILSLQNRYGLDSSYSDLVEETVLHLFKQVAKPWKLNNELNRYLLIWASKVHEIGLVISHAQYHKHGAYLILHSDLAGFSRLSQLYLANLVRTHRRKMSDEYFMGMKPEEAEEMKRLSVLFRLAVALTSDRSKSETECVLSCDDSNLTLTLGEQWHEDHPLHSSSLELEADYLRKAGFTLKVN